MQGVHSLQDLKRKLIDFGTEVLENQGWYLITPHGVWGMSLGSIYLNNHKIDNLDQARELAKFKIDPPKPEAKKVKTKTTKIRSKKKISKSKK
jgi:hypothetical protein